MARISRLVVPKYPYLITQRGVRSMAIFQTDEERRAYLQLLAEEAERFGVEILVCGVEPGSGWNRQEGLGLSVVQCFFSHGAQQEGPARERSAMGRLGEEVAEFLTGPTSAKDQAIRQKPEPGGRRGMLLLWT